MPNADDSKNKHDPNDKRWAWTRSGKWDEMTRRESWYV